MSHEFSCTNQYREYHCDKGHPWLMTVMYLCFMCSIYVFYFELTTTYFPCVSVCAHACMFVFLWVSVCLSLCVCLSPPLLVYFEGR